MRWLCFVGNVQEDPAAWLTFTSVSSIFTGCQWHHHSSTTSVSDSCIKATRQDRSAHSNKVPGLDLHRGRGLFHVLPRLPASSSYLPKSECSWGKNPVLTSDWLEHFVKPGRFTTLYVSFYGCWWVKVFSKWAILYIYISNITHLSQTPTRLWHLTWDKWWFYSLLLGFQTDACGCCWCEIRCLWPRLWFHKHRHVWNHMLW